MAGGITLAFIAFCGQHVDNLLLSYVISKWNHVKRHDQTTTFTASSNSVSDTWNS